MRALRNFSFVVLCWAFLASGGSILADGSCNAPGLLGTGQTAQEAFDACEDDGSNRCSELCDSHCQNWIENTTDCHPAMGGGQSWTSIGACKCTTPL